jgi:tRNA-specific 2-thiouridylase
MDFEKEYKQYVVEYMIDGYKQGLTPNPDVMCNKEIKFGFFLKKVLELGADYVATGHYVRIKTQNSKLKTQNFYKLYEAKDKNKDQSYFLWTLTQEQLAHCLFPIGDYMKPEVRKIAKKAGLPTAEKKDSQGICFLGKVTLVDFLKEHIPPAKGTVVNERGEAIGEHDGATFYTIGQRHGMNLRMSKNDTKPRYVASKDVGTNTIVAVEGAENQALHRKEIELISVNFLRPLHDLMTNDSMTVLARVRYRQSLANATLYRLQTADYKLVFDRPQKFVAPGQSAVFYSREGEVFGGGVIAN